MPKSDSTTAAENSQPQRDATSPVYADVAWPRRDDKQTSSKDPSETGSAEDEPRPWRDGVVLSYQYKAVFDVPIDLQAAELPRWRPRSIGEYGRAAQGDE
jgi:hypothetical protein